MAAQLIYLLERFEMSIDTTLEQRRRQQIAENSIGDSVVSVADAIDLTTIYSMFLKPVLHQFLEEIGKYFLFPIAAGAHVIKSILAWRQAYLDQGRARSVVPAIVETVATAAIVTAVIGTLVASTLFSLATPIIFTAAIGGKMLFHSAAAIYYGVKAARTEDAALKQENKTLAIKNGVTAIAGMIATAAVACVFLFGKIALAPLGIVSGIIGGTLAVIKGYQAYKASQIKVVTEVSFEPQSGSSLSIVKGLGLNNHDFNAVASHDLDAKPANTEETKPLLVKNSGQDPLFIPEEQATSPSVKHL
jgi:hypothetical protein